MANFDNESCWKFVWFAGSQGSIFPGRSVWVTDLPEGRVI